MKTTIYINNKEYEVADGIFNFIARTVGKELRQVELTDSDGNVYPATVCEEESIVQIG